MFPICHDVSGKSSICEFATNPHVHARQASMYSKLLVYLHILITFFNQVPKIFLAYWLTRFCERLSHSYRKGKRKRGVLIEKGQPKHERKHKREQEQIFFEVQDQSTFNHRHGQRDLLHLHAWSSLIAIEGPQIQEHQRIYRRTSC